MGEIIPELIMGVALTALASIIWIKFPSHSAFALGFGAVWLVLDMINAVTGRGGATFIINIFLVIIMVISALRMKSHER